MELDQKITRAFVSMGTATQTMTATYMASSDLKEEKLLFKWKFCGCVFGHSLMSVSVVLSLPQIFAKFVFQ